MSRSIFCSYCGQDKTVSEFYPAEVRQNTKKAKCKECQREYARRRNKLRTKREEQHNNLKRLYGITIEEYENLYVMQGGRWLICNVLYDVLSVDHNHKTNQVRGLLCKNCNFGLGHFRDDPELLHSAINYLSRREAP
jgi:hypothetical protein